MLLPRDRIVHRGRGCSFMVVILTLWFDVDDLLNSVSRAPEAQPKKSRLVSAAHWWPRCQIDRVELLAQRSDFCLRESRVWKRKCDTVDCFLSERA